jgi:hypothetical protein
MELPDAKIFRAWARIRKAELSRQEREGRKGNPSSWPSPDSYFAKV